MMKIRHMFALVGVVVLGGCASTPHADYSSSFEGDPVEVAQLFDGWTGDEAAWEDLVSKASESDVVLIGETHGHALGLAAAAALWDELLERTDSAALCLEFYERDQQTILDDFLSEIIEESEFRRLTRRTAGNFPAGHRQMIEAAKTNGRTVYAANAPRRYVRYVGKEGYDAMSGLSEEQSRLFVVPEEMPGGAYKDEFIEMMSGMGQAHGQGQDAEEMSEEEKAERVEGMFRSQAMWDATMSDTVARALSDGNSPVVLVIGRFHVDNEGGTVQLLRNAAPDASILVVVIDESAEGEMAQDELGRADFVLHVGGP